MRGRKPKPTHLKLVAGNPGRRPLNRREPKPRRVIPSPPAHLSPAALVVWGRASAVLDRMGVLTEADTIGLERICETYVEVVDLTADIAKRGRTQRVKTKAGGYMERQRPQFMMLSDADKRLRAWIVEFGQTPSARSRVHAEDDAGRKEDPFAKYFGA